MEPISTDIVVVGAGPGGYTAAFYAADHGRKVILVEREPRLGGVCLNRGCIPSKALLNAAHVINVAREAEHWGLQFAPPQVDLARLRAWKESILQKLGGGVAQLAQRRQVQVLTGRGYFEDSETLRVETATGQQFIRFNHAIVATGSKPAMPKAFDLGNPRIMTSTEALELEEVPPKLLVVGGGYIGMELGTVYATLGSQVVVVEAAPQILTGADPDLARPIAARAAKRFKEIRTGVKVLDMATKGSQIKVTLEWDGERREELYDRVLVAVGAYPTPRIWAWKTPGSPATKRASSRWTSTSKPRTRASWPSATLPAGCSWRTRPRARRALPSNASWANRPRRRISSSRRWCSPIRSWPGAA